MQGQHRQAGLAPQGTRRGLNSAENSTTVKRAGVLLSRLSWGSGLDCCWRLQWSLQHRERQGPWAPRGSQPTSVCGGHKGWLEIGGGRAGEAASMRPWSHTGEQTWGRRTGGACEAGVRGWASAPGGCAPAPPHRCRCEGADSSPASPPFEPCLWLTPVTLAGTHRPRR